jgi:hypothetical protein
MIIVKIQGGLGNQLFQYASARRISIINDIPIKLDLKTILDANYPFKYRLNMFNIVEQVAEDNEINKLVNVKGNPYLIALAKKSGINCIYNKKTHVIEKSSILPDKKVLNCSHEVYLEGWLSSESYFKDIRNLLLYEFTLKNPSDDYNKTVLKEISKCESVAVHIRRGDYAQNAYFGLLPLSYYYKAISYIQESIADPVFYVFSNDIEWVKQNLKLEGTFKFMDKNSQSQSISYTQNDYEDINLIRNCKHQIIANSTFSWWGAWLNENPAKQVYFPSLWYNDTKAQKQFENNNFIPSDWIKVQF